MISSLLVCIPFLFQPVQGDRVETKSGEVLQGKLLTMTEGKLTFESDSAGKLELSWDEVAKLVTEGEHEVVLLDGTRSKMRLDESTDFSRFKAVDPAPFKPLEGDINAGFTWASGNTDRVNAALTASALYKFEKDRLTGRFSWFYAEEKNDVTNERELTERRTAGELQYDHFLGDRSFLYGRAEALGDYSAEIQLRFVAGAGFGYQFVKEDDQNLNGEIGLGWRYEDRVGQEVQDETVARVAANGDRKLTEAMSGRFDIQWLPSLEDKDKHLVNLNIGVSWDLGSALKSTLQYGLDYDSDPGPGLEKDDHRILFTLGWNF